LVALFFKFDLLGRNQSPVFIAYGIVYPFPYKDVSATIAGVQIFHGLIEEAIHYPKPVYVKANSYIVRDG
jgi:Zn-dependent M28 family amino/carboxypeptidase